MLKFCAGIAYCHAFHRKKFSRALKAVIDTLHIDIHRAMLETVLQILIKYKELSTIAKIQQSAKHVYILQELGIILRL